MPNNTPKSLFERLQGLFPQLNVDVLALPEDDFQRACAKLLRMAAINHLANGAGIVAKSFRGEYHNTGEHASYGAFLREQAKEGVWGTYIEAAALGELLGCNVVATPVKNGVEQEPICLYRSEEKENKENNVPTLHLYNSNNTHWYVNSKTKGDGNCLYNAIAQGLRAQIHKQNPELMKTPKPTPVPRPQVSAGLFGESLKKEQKRAIQQQHQIELKIKAVIARYPTPPQMRMNLKKEQQRIARLPRLEQQQIAADYRLALQLAAQQMKILQPNQTLLPGCRALSEQPIMQPRQQAIGLS